MIKYRAKHKIVININSLKEIRYEKCIIKIESNDELKEINSTKRMWCYFDDIIKFEDFNLDGILIDEKSYGNILVYNVS